MRGKSEKCIFLFILLLFLTLGRVFINKILAYEAGEGSNIGLRVLLRLGADINTIDNNRTPLEYAIENQRNEEAKMLITCGADVNIGNIETEDTPLMGAAYYGQVDVVESLLKNGVNINARNRSGKSALWWAQEGEKDEYGSQAVTLLKQAGARL